MPRLIDADKTIGLLKTRLYETALNNATTVCDASYLYTECADNRIEAWINELPTVDAEKHGRWIYLYDGNYKCSECGSWWTCEETPIESGMLFCPNCGASMDEVEDAKEE